MSWDSKSALSRRRQNSTATRARGLSLHARQQSKAQPGIKIEPKSAHTSDPFLQEFLNPAFDPAEYLNASLPPLQGPTSASLRPGQQGKPQVPLAELSTEAQTLLSQLNAHTTRLTNTLTQLTDDILRSGSRLAYEVELLRGETLGLAETLAEGLKGDVERFVPGGLAQAGVESRPPPIAATSGPASPTIGRRASLVVPVPAEVPAPKDSPLPAGDADGEKADEPEYVKQLRTLSLVRERLDSVIKTFGDAMEFVFPPSELSVGSSFLSVSAPDPGKEAHSTEEKGQQILQKLRNEISGLLAFRDGADSIKGIEDAAKKIEELKELAKVWKGTAEEKGRAKFIESLAKMVEDRHRELLREVEQANRKGSLAGGRGDDGTAGSKRGDNGGGEATAAETRGPLGGYGFISQLQKIRSGL